MERFRGLVHKTASLIEADLEDDYDDIVQILWMKCWYASLRYDADASRMTLERYVFMCMKNAVKDLQKKRVRGEASLEELQNSEGSLGFKSQDKFDGKYLAVQDDVVYAEVEAEPLHLPNTLTDRERDVVMLLAADFSQTEARALLGIDKRGMEKVMRDVRVKLADWKPSSPAGILALEQPAAPPALAA